MTDTQTVSPTPMDEITVRLVDLGLAPENLRFQEPADDGVPQLAETVLAAVFEAIVACLKAGERVRSNGFGIIEVKDRPARNPATGEAIEIAASRKLTFRPAKELKAAV